MSRIYVPPFISLSGRSDQRFCHKNLRPFDFRGVPDGRVAGGEMERPVEFGCHDFSDLPGVAIRYGAGCLAEMLQRRFGAGEIAEFYAAHREREQLVYVVERALALHLGPVAALD